MAKFHISPDGMARRCNAGKGENARGCHYGLSDAEHYTTKEDATKAAEQQLNKENGGSFGSVKKNEKNNDATDLIEESKEFINFSHINGVPQFNNNYDPINGEITFTKGKNISVSGLFRKKKLKSQDNIKINIDDFKETGLLKDSNNLQRITEKQTIKSVILNQEFDIPEIKNTGFTEIQQLSTKLNRSISTFKYWEKRTLHKGLNFKIIPLPNNGKNSSEREIKIHDYLTSNYVDIQVATQQYYDFVEENKEKIFKAESEENYKILENINKHPDSFNTLKKLDKTKQIKNPELRKEARELIGKELIKINKEVESYNKQIKKEKDNREKDNSILLNEKNNFLKKQEKSIDEQNDDAIMRELFG